MVQATRLLRRIDLLMRLKFSVTEAGRILGSSKTRIHRLAQENSVGRRRRSLSEAKVQRLRELLDEGHDHESIAKQLRIHKWTVREFELKFLDEVGPLKVRPLRFPVRCDDCGNTIAVTPCVICAARAGKADDR